VHNNYYFLRQLTQKLERTLSHAVISECFSQNKDELIIRLETKFPPFFIRASLTAQFSCLSFPGNLHRAKKNSVDLFQPLIGQRVEGFRQFENERSFTMNCSNQYSLLFKMHGNRSNLVLYHNRDVVDIFKNSMTEDGKLNLAEMDREINWSYDHFMKHRTQPASVYFTFGKIVWKYLASKHFDQLSVEQQWDSIQTVRYALENPQDFYIKEMDEKIFFSLLNVGATIKKFTDPVVAVTEFFSYYIQHDTFSRRKAAALSLIKSKLHANENYLDKTKKKLHELEQDNNYKLWADLLMGNLHAIAPGLSHVKVPDLYRGDRPIEIKLKPDLSVQKNAAIYYKKGKNQQTEIRHLQELIANKKMESSRLADMLAKVEVSEDVKSLQKHVESFNVADSKKQQVVALPYRELEFNGYKIWVGRNAQANDTLTLKFGYKDDLWLHAKDVPGSHVLIKYQAGHNFPKDVIERAAELAAYHSKRKNESLCPVAVTPRKFVRKRKGDPAGVVVVEKEKVMMVVPRGF
jgi:predicted ribosome quality control (RQC) complex YloA/Tae2 family protein